MKWNLLNKKELKIFLTFFLLFSYFINWPGMNENSRFFLTRAIVDEGRFEIDTFYNQTSDRAYHNDHYYSDKEPGTSFLAVPSYAVWKFIYNNIFPKNFVQQFQSSNEYKTQPAHGDRIVILDNPGGFTLSSMMVVTIFTSCIFSALTAVLVYKISKYYTNNETHRLLAVLTYGIGSLAFHYSLVFLGYLNGAFFSFLAFYILLKTQRENIRDSKWFLASGIFAGVSIVIELSTVLISGLLFLYLLASLNTKKRKKIIPLFLIGGLIGISPFLIYNFLIFGNPIDLPRNHMDPVIWKNLQENIGVRFNPSYNFHVILRLLVFPYKGLFIYFPILALSIPGFYFMYREDKKHRKELMLLIGVFLSILCLASMWWAWWHGAVFGPRLLMPMVPFLVVPIIYTFKKLDMRLVVGLLVLSILINMMGLQAHYEDILKDLSDSEMKPEYQERFDNFQILEDPIMNYYWPLFSKFGPRSRIFEHLLYKEGMVDIRASNQMVSNNIPFLSLVPVSIFFIVIWYSTIRRFVRQRTDDH